MAGDGLRERKKRETRIALSWAAIRLTVERGYANVRVEDIAAAAGVSPRTFNNYFASKAEAITERQLDRARLIADELRARPADEPLWEAITAAVRTRFAMGTNPGEADRAWWEGVRVMVREPALQAEFLRVNALAGRELAIAVAERTGTDVQRDLYPNLVGATVRSALDAVTEHWLRTEPATSQHDLITAAFELIAAGLPPQESR